MNLSCLFALKYFSSNIQGTTCFAFSPKLRLDHVVLTFNCLFVYLLASTYVCLIWAMADFTLVLGRANSNYLTISFGNTYSQ